MRRGGLEPPHLAVHAPQTCVSAIPPPSQNKLLKNYFLTGFLGVVGSIGVAAAAPSTFEVCGIAEIGSFPITLLVEFMLLDRVKTKLVKRNKMAQTEVVFVKKFPAPLLPKIL